MTSYALSLALGLYHNPGQRKRFLAEWQEITGFGRKFAGRWEDGWISGAWQSEQAVPGNATSLQVSGKHWAPGGPLTVTVKLDGKTIQRQEVAPGEYAFAAPVAAEHRGKTCKLEISTSRTWRPKENGDYRQLGCVVDAIRFEPVRAGQ
jgi:hypothetical protein